MRQILIRFNGRMVGGLWLRGRIEISENGIACGSEIRSDAQFCPTPPEGQQISYQVFSPEPERMKPVDLPTIYRDGEEFVPAPIERKSHPVTFEMIGPKEAS